MADARSDAEAADDPGGDGGPDLTPRQAPKPRSATRRWGAVAVVALVVVAIGVVLWKGLGDASLFFRNVDDAVAQREDLGDARFRMQGTPVSGTITDTTTADGEAAVAFTIRYDGVEADVVHVGSPAELFQPEVPVVIDGRWVGDDTEYYFLSDRMLVKHDNDYEVDQGERIDEAEERGSQ